MVSSSAMKPLEGKRSMRRLSRIPSFRLTFSISAYCVSNWLRASICLLRSSAAGWAPSPATTRLMSVSGFRPEAAASARDDDAGRGHVGDADRLALEVGELLDRAV